MLYQIADCIDNSGYGEDNGRIVPFFKNVCYEPIDRADVLKEVLMNKYPTLRA
jgi:hypothetical protein